VGVAAGPTDRRPVSRTVGFGTPNAPSTGTVRFGRLFLLRDTRYDSDRWRSPNNLETSIKMVRRKADRAGDRSTAMELTRHVTATVYVVADGVTALHEHPGLGLRLPPGGHVDRGELPHEAALREAREETGLDPTLLTDHADISSETARSIPRPRHLMLADVNVCNGEVGHQHVDHVFYATAERRAIDPDPGEVGSEAWAWYDRADLRDADIDDDVRELGIEAIDAAERRSGA
jgi:8-oxo-dGTP pyrophosphatase MutT (NUDIX family)